MSALLHAVEPPGGASDRVGAATFVLGLRAKGIFDLNVLRAMELAPRDFFAPRRYADLARSDVALPLPFGQTMTAPVAVAAMLAALGCREGHRVLEIGTGSGYVTALLAAMGASVHTVERIPALAESARVRLGAVGFRAEIGIACRDGLADAADLPLYDRILVNGALEALPGPLTSRLAAGGRLVAALSTWQGPRLVAVERGADGTLSHEVGAPIRIGTMRIDNLVNPGGPTATEA